jgi:hypothetical protein
MATAWVTEYANLARDGQHYSTPLPQEPAITTQTFTFTTHAESAAFNEQTNFVRVYASAAARIAFGASPTAIAGSTPIAATVDYWFGVHPGQKVSIYDGSS